MTFARAGGIVRLGKNLSGFGPDSVEAGGAMLQGTHAKNPSRPRCEYYLFAGFDVRAVAYNAFLDGNLLRSSPGVDRKPVVYDVLSGLSLRYNTARPIAHPDPAQRGIQQQRHRQRAPDLPLH